VALDPHRLDAVAEEALTEMLAEGESTNTVASLATWLAASRVREGQFSGACARERPLPNR